MKIALPVDEKKTDTDISMSYGRCAFFLVYDTESKEYGFIENEASSQASAAGISASQALIDEEVSCIITERLGENAADLLKEAGIKVYKAGEKNTRKLLSSCLEGRLEELKEVSKGFFKRMV